MSKPGSPPRTQGEQRERPPDGVAPGVDGAELGPDVEMDAPPAQRTLGTTPGLDRAGQLVVGQAELARPRADRQAVLGLGLDRGVEAQQDVDGRSGAPGQRGEVRGLVGRLERDPAERLAATRRPGPPRRRSARDLPTPSRLIRSFGSPARRATDHSPLDTTFAPRPAAARRATTAATSFALTEYCRIHGSGNAARSSSAAAARPAASVR